MKIAFVYADSHQEWNCSEWRCAVPARAINRTRSHQAELISILDFGQNSEIAKEVCGKVDMIVVQRNLFGPVLSAIQHWKARDKVVIADFDDAYDLIPSRVKNYEFWRFGTFSRMTDDGQMQEGKIDPPPLTQFKWGLRLVHAATTPSQMLLEDWHDYTTVYLLPNYIDLENYERAIPERHEGVQIGWGGSLSHLQSFTGSGVLRALEAVCQARPQVKIVLNGGDQRIFNQLHIAEDQKVLRPWVPYAKWPYELAHYDIGLAPLNGAYDQRRSWIKVLEYMIMKIPWAASEGPAYHELRSYGWLVENTASAWERMLLDMIDHLKDYKAEASTEPYLFGVSQSIDANVEKIISTYSSIIEQALG